MAEEATISDPIKAYISQVASSAPQSQSNQNAPTTSQGASVSIEQPPAGIEQYARQGVPLDTTTGAPFMTRAGLSFAETPEDKQAYLKSAYANSTVEPTKDGNNFIVRNVLDQTNGKTVDLLVNPKGLHLSDLADLTHAGVRMAGELAGMYLGGEVIPAINRLKGFTDVAVKSGIGALSGNALDAATSTLERASVDGMSALSDLRLGEHVKQAIADTGAGFALGSVLEGGAKALNAIRGTLGSELAPGASESVGIQSIKDLERDTGIKIQPSLGQMAEDPSVQKLETFTSKLPYFGKALQEQEQQRQDAVRDLQRRTVDQLTGGKPLQPLSDLGANIAEVVKRSIQDGRADQTVASASMVSRASQELTDAIDSISPAARSFTTETTADITKAAAQAQNAQFRDVSRKLFEDAGNPLIPTAPLKPLLEDVQKNLAKHEVVNESDLVDLHGRPFSTTSGREVIHELVPSELNRFLSGLGKMDAQMPLEELRNIRSTVDNAIIEGRGLEGVSTHQLKQVQHALTETINQGASSLGEAGQKILRANKFYKENIERFEVPFVSRLLKKEADAPGYMRSFDLISQIRDNPDTFRDVEKFLTSGVHEGGTLLGGTSQKTFDTLRRGLLEDVLAKSRVSPGGVGKSINADSFINQLNQFRPEVRSAITGVQEETLAKNLDLLRQLKEGFKDVPADGLEAFLRFPNNNLQDLSNLATSFKKEKELFNNEIVKKLFNGSLTDLDHVQSDQALAYLMDAKNVGDVHKFMALMSGHPEVVQQIQGNAVAQLFQRVAQATKPSDAAHLNDLSQLVSAPKLIEALRDQGTRDKLRAIIGSSSFNILENFAKSQAVLGKEGTQSIVGSATATSTLIHMTKLLTNWPQTAKFIMYGKVLTNPGLQRAVMEGSLSSGVDVREFTKSIIASQPVLEALTKEFGKTGTELLMQSASAALNSSQPMTIMHAVNPPKKPVMTQVDTNSIRAFIQKQSPTKPIP